MHQTLDEIAQAINEGDFKEAEKLYLKLQTEVKTVNLEFDPRTGYTEDLFYDWMDTLNKSIKERNITNALEAQSAVYEMLDVLM